MVHVAGLWFGMENLEWRGCGYSMVEKIEEVFTLFDGIHEGDG